MSEARQRGLQRKTDGNSDGKRRKERDDRPYGSSLLRRARTGDEKRIATKRKIHSVAGGNRIGGRTNFKRLKGVTMKNITWQSENRALSYETRLLLSLANAVGAGRMRQAVRELVKAYIHGVSSKELGDVFELLVWNQGIGFFSSEIGPSALFSAYKLIKNGEKQGKSRDEICLALREKFGEKNEEVRV